MLNPASHAVPSCFRLFVLVQMFEHVDELAPALLKTLSDVSDKVVKLDLEVLAEMSSTDEGEAEDRREQAESFFKR